MNHQFAAKILRDARLEYHLARTRYLIAAKQVERALYSKSLRKPA
jgi:hypothetical protein